MNKVHFKLGLVNKISVFIFFFSSAFGLSSQVGLNQNSRQFSDIIYKIEQDSAIKIYYDIEQVRNLSFDDKTDNLRLLENELEDHGLTLLRYTQNQFVIIGESDLELSQKEWDKRERLAIQFQNAKDEDITIIGEYQLLTPNKKYIVSGTIEEENTNIPIIGATVSTGQIGAITDVNGYYELTLLSGKHLFNISSVGFDAMREEVLIYGDGVYNQSLFSNSVELEEVIISGKADNENISSIEIGVEELSLKEIQQLPSFMGELDVIKSLLSLPGVSTAGEGVGGINVRGGNVDHNLIIQDGILFFNPSHSLGFFNLFHPDLVDEVKLYKGNIPAKYGGRISSVLYTSSKTGSKTKWSGKAGLGLSSSKISIDGPIIKDKLSMTLGGRLSTANWLIKGVNVPDVKKSKIDFYDLQGKLNYWIDENSNIGLQFYNSDDDFRLSDELQFDYQTQAISLFYNKLIGDNKSLNARIVSSEYSSNLNDLLPTNSSRFNAGVNYVSGKIDLTIEKQKSFLNIGLEGIRYSVQPGSVFPGDAISDIETEIVDDEIGLELGVYANSEIEITDKIKILAGLRLSGFGLLGPKDIRHYNTTKYFDSENLVDSETISGGTIETFYGIEPRIAANYNISESSSLKIGYNRTFQYLSQISNTVAATPIDFWKVSDNNIKPQSAHSISLGLFKNFNNNLWKTSAEIYYRKISNSLAYRDFADLLANEHIETELLIGEGRHYGAELSFEKTVGKLTSRIGYSYTRSLLKMEFDNPNFTINSGEWYPSNFDKPHNLNLLMNVNLSKRISFNFNFSYSTGRSISAPIGKYDDFNVLGVPLFDRVNNFRIPDYHRLDFSINVFPGYRKDKKVKGSWNFSLFNVYGRKNAYSVFFRQESIDNLQANKLSVLGTVFPSISYNIIFE